ncbi:histidinol dehydrogenase [Pantoea ananatis]
MWKRSPACAGSQITRPMKSVGLYIPGGSAPLFSTVLMLATPARIAGCGRVVLCSPPPIADEILYAAKLCGVEEVFRWVDHRRLPPWPLAPKASLR